jgi:hypothetical protein
LHKEGGLKGRERSNNSEPFYADQCTGTLNSYSISLSPYLHEYKGKALPLP